MSAYSLCDVVDNNSAICISVVHRSKRLVSFLSCCIPYFKFDGGGVIERDCLSEKSSSYGGLPIVIKLVLPDILSHTAKKIESAAADNLWTCLDKSEYQRALGNNMLVGVVNNVMAERNDTFPTADSPTSDVSIVCPTETEP